MKQNSNTSVELVENVKKDLIGGFILRYGDEQFDASVIRKLKSLRKDFKANLYVKDF
jgi:F-type H+-transporting ATPase subunit delta